MTALRPGVALLPLRLFLGATFVYGGVQKLTDRRPAAHLRNPQPRAGEKRRAAADSARTEGSRRKGRSALRDPEL